MPLLEFQRRHNTHVATTRYQGPFFFGNVKSVVDWHASNSSGLFPNGLSAFADKLDLPLQLYTPFWNDKFATKYRTFESTQFHGTKRGVPDDSYHFFADFFDLGQIDTFRAAVAHSSDLCSVVVASIA